MKRKISALIRVSIAASFLASHALATVSIEYVTVGDAGQVVVAPPEPNTFAMMAIAKEPV